MLPPYAQYARQSRQWVPRDLGATCKLWLPPEMGVTLGAADVITAYANSGAAGGTLTASGPTRRPTQDTFGTRGCMRSTGVSSGTAQYLLGDAFSAYTTTLACTVAFVFSVSAVVNPEGDVGTGDWLVGDQNGERIIELQGADGSYALKASNWNGGDYQTHSVPVSLDTAYVVVFRHGDGLLSLSVNGIDEVPILSGNNDDDTGAIGIGGIGDRRIAEPVICNTDIGDANAERLAFYLGAKFGIALG